MLEIAPVFLLASMVTKNIQPDAVKLGGLHF